MIIEAQLAYGEFFEEDSDKLGWIKVWLHNRVLWARPMLPYGEYYVPSKEWIKKYAYINRNKTKISVYVTKVNNSESYLWTGFSIYRPGIPKDALVNYTRRRVMFTENWISYYDDKSNEFLIKHNDGTKIQITRTPNLITLYDGITKFGIDIAPDGVSIYNETLGINLKDIIKDILDTLNIFALNPTAGNGVPFLPTKSPEILTTTTKLLSLLK